MRLQVTLAEPDGMWSQPEGNATHGFYSSSEWKRANKKAQWLTKNVPGDGMCGWGAIMLIIGWLTLNDMVFSSKKEPCGWTPDGWMKVLDFLKEVSIFIRTTLRGPRTNLTDYKGLSNMQEIVSWAVLNECARGTRSKDCWQMLAERMLTFW